MAFIKKYELGFKYFPDAPSKKAATDNLTRAINNCGPLYAALVHSPGGYNVDAKTYTPLQVKLISEYLGDPE